MLFEVLGKFFGPRMSSSETDLPKKGHHELVEKGDPKTDLQSSDERDEQDNTIVLKFPFAINGADRVSHFETTVERMHDHISFALPFDLGLCIDGAVLMSKEFSRGWVVYVFEFSSLDSAIEWMTEKPVTVELRPKNGDLHAIRKEMDDFMLSYEEGERKKRKKRVMIDEEGFTYYE